MANLPDSYIVVANRSDSSISILNSKSADLIKNIDMETLGFEFEPMYVSHLKPAEVFVVGDRKKNQILIFDDVSAQLLATVALSEGVFHQWAKPGDNLVVVATDGMAGADLIQITRNTAGRLDIKTDRFEVSGAKSEIVPHDVVIDDDFFYLTAHDSDQSGKEFDKLLKVSRKSLKIVDSKVFSKDIHVGLPQASPYLIVAEQTGVISFLTRHNMKIVKQVKNVPGAHGLFWNPDGTRLYSANIGSAGPGSLYVIQNTQQGAAQVLSTLDSGFDKPHNLVADFDSNLLFLTHSGMNDRVSVYDISENTKLIKNVVTGANPFGIGIIKR